MQAWNETIFNLQLVRQKMEDKQSERCSPREKGNVPYPMERISLHLSARREEEEKRVFPKRFARCSDRISC